jgi:hypothetical protein
MKNCLECPFHEVISDPDPHDWFCDDDKAVVCTKLKNDKQDKNSKYSADRQEFKCVTISCRPYNLKKECNIPDWCPLVS